MCVCVRSNATFVQSNWYSSFFYRLFWMVPIVRRSISNAHKFEFFFWLLFRFFSSVHCLGCIIFTLQCSFSGVTKRVNHMFNHCFCHVIVTLHSRWKISCYTRLPSICVIVAVCFDNNLLCNVCVRACVRACCPFFFAKCATRMELAAISFFIHFFSSTRCFAFRMFSLPVYCIPMYRIIENCLWP